jgi:hypothetical protein
MYEYEGNEVVVRVFHRITLYPHCGPGVGP